MVESQATEDGLHLYTWTTPNGRKISIALEEMGLSYSVHPVALREKRQKEPWFLALNPNGRIPVLVDDGEPIFESGAILLYLAEKTGRLLPVERRRRWLAVQWLMWQVGGLGPMQGQANVFNRYWPEDLPGVKARYVDETARLFGVLDARLAEATYLADEFSIADIACYPWVAQHDWSGVSLDGFAHLRRWFAELSQRPALQRGMDVPQPQEVPDAATGRAIVR